MKFNLNRNRLINCTKKELLGFGTNFTNPHTAKIMQSALHLSAKVYNCINDTCDDASYDTGIYKPFLS